MTRRRLESRAAWVPLDVAARLAAASPATIRGWVRRGSVRSDAGDGAGDANGNGDGKTVLSVEDVVTCALARRRTTDPAALHAQLDAALAQLHTVTRALAEVEDQDDQSARREAWSRGQHEREMREIYVRWEQERSRWEQERKLLEASGSTAAPASPGPLPNGHVTSKPPVNDELLPPLSPGPRPRPDTPTGDITPSGRPRVRWRRT